MVSEPRFDL